MRINWNLCRERPDWPLVFFHARSVTSDHEIARKRDGNESSISSVYDDLGRLCWFQLNRVFVQNHSAGIIKRILNKSIQFIHIAINPLAFNCYTIYNVLSISLFLSLTCLLRAYHLEFIATNTNEMTSPFGLVVEVKNYSYCTLPTSKVRSNIYSSVALLLLQLNWQTTKLLAEIKLRS